MHGGISLAAGSKHTGPWAARAGKTMVENAPPHTCRNAEGTPVGLSGREAAASGCVLALGLRRRRTKANSGCGRVADDAQGCKAQWRTRKVLVVKQHCPLQLTGIRLCCHFVFR